MSPDTLPYVVTGLLSVGGATFLTSVVRGWATLRGGARAHQREAVMDLAERANAADERERVAALDRDYWRSIAGKYGYQLRVAGINPDPSDPIQPSDRPLTADPRRPRLQ